LRRLAKAKPAAKTNRHFPNKVRGITEDRPEKIRRWLAASQAVTPGAKMVTFNFTDAQLTQLIAYLETLK
jgi:cytochrome c1